MAARNLRYLWFEEIRKEHGYNYIATAHNQDDEISNYLQSYNFYFVFPCDYSKLAILGFVTLKFSTFNLCSPETFRNRGMSFSGWFG